MFFSIDPHNGVAIYEQLIRQVKFGVAEGTLRPGQLLPSARILSQQLAINPNTINRAFQQLQLDGVLESIRARVWPYVPELWRAAARLGKHSWSSEFARS
jgi:GntR family transcriptional regulator